MTRTEAKDLLDYIEKYGTSHINSKLNLKALKWWADGYNLDELKMVPPASRHSNSPENCIITVTDDNDFFGQYFRKSIDGYRPFFWNELIAYIGYSSKTYPSVIIDREQYTIIGANYNSAILHSRYGNILVKKYDDLLKQSFSDEPVGIKIK